jgi:hypothetical protein
MAVPPRARAISASSFRDDLISSLGTPWRGFSDHVMGGVSRRED